MLAPILLWVVLGNEEEEEEERDKVKRNRNEDQKLKLVQSIRFPSSIL